MALATPTRWRLVLLTSALLSLLQVLVSTGIAESPAWLAGNGKAQEARLRIRTYRQVLRSAEARERLLGLVEERLTIFEVHGLVREGKGVKDEEANLRGRAIVVGK